MTDSTQGSNPAHVTVKLQLMRKATGNHLIKSISLEQIQKPVSVFCYARIDQTRYAWQCLFSSFNLINLFLRNIFCSGKCLIFLNDSIPSMNRMKALLNVGHQTKWTSVRLYHGKILPILLYHREIYLRSHNLRL